MQLDVSEKSLSELLAKPREQLTVPLYQRAYSWTTEEVDQLWEDITGSLESEHFMGSIVLNEENKLRPQVIDGQQRLTTLMILLALIRDEYNAVGSHYEGRPHQLLIADPWGEGEDRYKLRLARSTDRSSATSSSETQATRSGGHGRTDRLFRRM
jgi:hypothetical protein